LRFLGHHRNGRDTSPEQFAAAGERPAATAPRTAVPPTAAGASSRLTCGIAPTMVSALMERRAPTAAIPHEQDSQRSFLDRDSDRLFPSLVRDSLSARASSRQGGPGPARAG